MANKILSVSILDDKIDILRLEMGMLNKYSVVEEIKRDVGRDVLLKAAKWADKININTDLPSADHYWNVFPNVNKRQLKQLVERHAVKTLGTRSSVRFGFRSHGLVTVDGVDKNEVSYLAAESSDVVGWERKTFHKYYKKICHVTSLPVALASAVVQSEHPKKDFMVVWAGKISSVFAISSSQGDIKVARNIPVGIDFKDDSVIDREEILESFAQEFDRDIMTTLLLYQDTFAQQSCEGFYFFGNQNLEAFFEPYSLKSAGGHEVFGLDNLPVRGLGKADKQAHYLLGNLFSHSYNLVDPAIIREQQFDASYRYASIVLLACIVAAGSWMASGTPSSGIEKKNDFESKTSKLAIITDKLYTLENKKIQLKRFSGWKNFYKNTYTNQPAWSQMFSSLAEIIPDQFVIDTFELVPGKNSGVHGWQCMVKGRINAVHWNDGLALFRLFGNRIHQLPYFEIIDVEYTTIDDKQNAASQKTSFDFSIKMKLTPQENK